MRPHEIRRAIVAIKVGESAIFSNERIRARDIISLAKSVASKRGFGVKTKVDHGGIRVEKTRNISTRIAKLMLSKLEDGNYIMFPASRQMMFMLKRLANDMEDASNGKAAYCVIESGSMIEVMMIGLGVSDSSPPSRQILPIASRFNCG